MRLSGFDEYPFHQHPTPFHTAATTDAHFNDGYWFAFYAPGWYFFAGLRLHPNVNVTDGWIGATHDNRQHVVRVSRALHPRYDELAVGPLHLTILEPMKRLRLTAATNSAGVEFDVEIEARAPPFVEARYQHVKFGAVINDLMRYTQVCRVYGKARVAGHDLAIERWHAIRDHSWGVRSSMAMPTGLRGIDRSTEARDDRALRLWVPFECGDHCGMFNTHEASDGRPLDFEGRLDYRDGRVVKLVAVRHELQYVRGTKRPIGGTLELDGADGITRSYRLSLTGTPADVQGAGYYGGWRDGYSAGVYRGADYLEHDSYDSPPGRDPSGPPHVPVARRPGPTEFPMRIVGEGGEGMAHFEHTVSRAYPRYGFAGQGTGKRD